MDILKKVSKLAGELFNTTFEIKVSNNTYKLNAKELGYTFGFDRAKLRFGKCSYTKKEITISKHLCKANPNQLDGKIKDNILHEIAHAFSYHLFGQKGSGHGWRWKTIAKQIGCNGKSKYSLDDFGGINQPQMKYTLTCPTCKKSRGKARKPKKSYACGYCCTNGYNPKHKLLIKQNY